MDSLGYTFFIPGIDVYIYPPPLSPLLLSKSLFAINWKFNCLPIFPQEGKKGGEREYPWNTLQFKVANSPFANLLLLL